MNNIKHKGIMPALVTPFDSNRKIKTKTVKELIDWHLSAGVNGFYICGSTGEGPALSVSTRKEMAESAKEAVNGRGVIINHIGAPNFEDAIDLINHSAKIGVDAISSLAPTYSYKYTEEEFIDYYKRIAATTDLPVIVYAKPEIGNVINILERLIKIPNIIGVKCTIREYFTMHKIKEINNGNINLINGPDETLICGLIMGADGGIGSTYNIMPNWFSELYEAYVKGDIEKAQKLQYRINKVIEVLAKYGVNGVINSTKATLTLMGYDIGKAVYPAKEYSSSELTAMKKELVDLGIEF